VNDHSEFGWKERVREEGNLDARQVISHQTKEMAEIVIIKEKSFPVYSSVMDEEVRLGRLQHMGFPGHLVVRLWLYIYIYTFKVQNLRLSQDGPITGI
jgi:hypothetical protein